MQQWERDKKWSDQFIPEIKTILTQYLIVEAPIEEDQRRNTDLIVLMLKPYRIACKVRRNEYLKKYSEEFTIRSGRPSGCKTDLQKIMEGWGDFFFYGFCDPLESRLIKYIMGDLNVFRLWFNRSLYKMPPNCCPGEKRENKDGTYFLSFKEVDMPDDFFVARFDDRVFPREQMALFS
jgi:hypothetical protein